VRSFLVAAFILLAGVAGTAPADANGLRLPDPALIPRPADLRRLTCDAPISLDRPLRFSQYADPGGFELLRARWTALGIPAPILSASDRAGGRLDVVVQSTALAAAARRSDEYSITVRDQVTIDYGESPESKFDALMTLAQLPVRAAGRWFLPCWRLDDAPAMRWRIVSDDVSRGPFPTMEYAKRRIRTLASLKINGWSPYMEHVFADPRYPFVAWPDRWTATQLHELSQYGRRFHVTLLPEQQTFAHTHETLKWEQLAPLAELPHGYLVTASDPATYRYLEPLVKSVLDATKPVPFVHLGADEPLDLGSGRSPRTPTVFDDLSIIHIS